MRPWLTLLFLLGVGLDTSACMSRCSSDADCVGSCPCDDGAYCTVGLRCMNTVCEVGESPLACFSGFSTCEKYKPKGLCGSKSCGGTEPDKQCKKECSCARQITNNNQTTACNWRCSQGFTCNLDEGMCDTNYAASTCEAICASVAAATQCVEVSDVTRQLTCTPVTQSGVLQ